MKNTNRRLLLLASVTAVSVLAIFAWLFSQIDQPRKITQLEVSVASLPLGMLEVDADKHMGSKPDRISETRGVFMSPVTMLAPENELAVNYGPPRDFTLREWSRDGISAVVAIDTDGKVAGRWSWRARED